MNPISFPNLNLTFLINPVAISIFGVDIHWYGIIIMFAVLLGIFLAKRDDGLYKIKFDDMFDFAIIAVIIGIVCARLYYVLFKLDYYINHLDEIFKIWNGGLAIYGGIIGAVVACVFFCKKRMIRFFNMTDYVVPFLALRAIYWQVGKFYKSRSLWKNYRSFFENENI